MSMQTRKEILSHTKTRYMKANTKEKSKILDELIGITAYPRKYAIHLLNKKDGNFTNDTNKFRKNTHKQKYYDESCKHALLTIWYAANQICSKRLVPFISEMVAVLEKNGHISLSPGVKSKLLKISAATVDRLLETARKHGNGGTSATRPGSLLKKQIKVRTFADWNDTAPGFLEGDLVAHCGDRTDGSFLNTLVLTDIASSWTEFFPLLKKGEAEVIAALKIAEAILPFPLVGLDTDNGSEFINYALLDFCRSRKITFTRSRAYKKNDQAHVEEKNGSIVRRLIGYDRFEGLDAYNALSELYAILRLYINFFQPSVKLVSKTRDGAKVSKKYDQAKTPYQRLFLSPPVTEEIKIKLKAQYEKLDPILLLKDLERLQNNFWKYAWKDKTHTVSTDPVENRMTTEEIKNYECTVSASAISNGNESHIEATSTLNDKITHRVGSRIENSEYHPSSEEESTNKLRANINLYRRSNKPRKQQSKRTWCTHHDLFESVAPQICIQLASNPKRTAKSILDELIKENPSKFNISHRRTLERRIAKWRKQQVDQEKFYQQIATENNMNSQYNELSIEALNRLNDKITHRINNSIKSSEYHLNNEEEPTNTLQMNINRCSGKVKKKHTWRTRRDPFENVLNQIHTKLVDNPESTAKDLLDNLIKENPAKFSLSQERTLQRRITKWRQEQIKIRQEKFYQQVVTENNVVSQYIAMVAHSVVKG